MLCDRLHHFERAETASGKPEAVSFSGGADIAAACGPDSLMRKRPRRRGHPSRRAPIDTSTPAEAASAGGTPVLCALAFQVT